MLNSAKCQRFLLLLYDSGYPQNARSHRSERPVMMMITMGDGGVCGIDVNGESIHRDAFNDLFE